MGATSMLSGTVYQQRRSKELIDSIMTGKQNKTDYSSYLNELNAINPDTANLYGTNVSYDNANINKYSANGGYFDQMQSKESYLNDLTTKISDMFNKREEATTGSYNLAYDNEIGALEKARMNLKTDGSMQRRELQANNIRQMKDLDRRRAENGLNNGGEALTNELQIDISNEENANKLGIEIIKGLGDIESKQVEALRNKDQGLKIALSQLGGEESGMLLSAYKEAENYNMTKLNYDLGLAQTQEQIRQAVLQAEERQKTFEEQVRQYSETQAENQRQFDTTFNENKRISDINIDLQKQQLPRSSGSGNEMTPYQKATMAENVRQFNESIRQYNLDRADNNTPYPSDSYPAPLQEQYTYNMWNRYKVPSKK